MVSEINIKLKQCFGSGPDLNGSADPDPDLGRPKLALKKGKKEEISCVESQRLYMDFGGHL